jgi:putative hydroxymethylpyrimidine transport system substrate-binding protein
MLLTGCGGDNATVSAERGPSAPRQVRITLNGYDGAENAGILMAEQRGFFREAGLKTVVTTPQTQRRSIRYVMHRWVEIAVSHQPQVILAQAKGAPVIAIGSLVSQPTATMIWLKKSGIRNIADLEGKTIAVPGVPFQHSFLYAALSRAGLEPEDVNVERAGYHLVQELESGRADAIFGGSSKSEAVELEERGFEPVVTPVHELGIPAYDELVLVARRDFVAENPQLVRAVNEAVVRGTAAALRSPGAVVGTIRKSYETYFADNRKTTEAKVEATLPLLAGTGYMDPGQAGELVDWMFGEGMIRRKVQIPEFQTNAYLPQEP